jgi:hypothetical protein
MVYLQKGSKTYKLRVTTPDGRTAILSTECKVEAKDDADDIEKAYYKWRGDSGERFAKPELLVALVEKRVSLRKAWEASLDGSLRELLAMAPVEPVAPPAPKSLVALVTEWYDWKRGAKKDVPETPASAGAKPRKAAKAKPAKGVKSAPDYLRQLKTLFPEIERGTFNVRHFTIVEVAKRIDELNVDSPTKNRYRIPCSGFAKFLVRRGVLETNFVRDIEGFGENDSRLVYYERPEAQRLVAGLAQPFAGAAACAAGFCMEYGGVSNALARDFHLETEGEEWVYVRGTKTKNRLRTVRLVDENRWVVPYIKAALAGKAPNAKVFAGLTKTVLLRNQQKVARALEVVAVGEDEFGQHTFHDWRHTHSVQLLRDGYEETVGAHDLGHKDVNLFRKVYARFIVTREDYRRKRIYQEVASASSATTTETTSLRALK